MCKNVSIAWLQKAMSEAEVGDDVFMGDPTVKLLEEKVAAILGKEDGLFVPSGKWYWDLLSFHKSDRPWNVSKHTS